MAFNAQDVSLPAQAAGGATVETIVAVAPSSFAETGWQLARVGLASPALVTGVATNNATFNIRQYRGGNPVAANGGTPATVTLGAGTNLAAFAELVIPLATAPNNVAAQAGDVFTVQMVQNGTGLAIPANVLARVEFA